MPRLAPILLVAVLLGGCAEAIGVPDPPSLTGRAFLSTSVVRDGTEAQLVPGTRIRVEFGQDESVRAVAGCNTISGRYTIAGGVLGFDDGGMTMMGCDPERHEQDDWLAKFLAARPTIALNGDVLVLTAGTASIRFADRRIAEPDSALVGPLWTLTTIVTGDLAASVPGRVIATLRFSDDGSVELNSGCNGGSARATFGDDRRITFDEVITNLRLCEGPAGQVETAFLGVVQAGPLTWSIEADTLTLSSGEQGLVFRSL
jgi:heat shock protein HslJ